MQEGAHALVFGSSGLAGWGIVDQLLKNYPEKGVFSKVTACINRPLEMAETYWLAKSSSCPQLDLACGINLMEGSVESFTASLKEKTKDIESVTHLFYFAYKQEMEPSVEVANNRQMLERAIGALDNLCPNLKFVVIPTGSKAYGIDIPREELNASEELKKFKAPYDESLGRLPAPYGDRIFYYKFHDILKERSVTWTWCDLRPDAIIGFAPNGSNFSLAALWASYLSLYAHVHSASTNAKQPPIVHFPGSESGYNSLFNPVTSTTIAKIAIFAALNPEKFGNGEIFNIADHSKPSTMAELWPKICEYFGLKGVGPSSTTTTKLDMDQCAKLDECKDDNLPPSKYIKKYSRIMEEKATKKNVVFQGEFLDSYGFYLGFDRHFDLEKIRNAGFKEEVDPIEGWIWAFDMFKKVGMIP